jgi:hypothetical protein
LAKAEQKEVIEHFYTSHQHFCYIWLTVFKACLAYHLAQGFTFYFYFLTASSKKLDFNQILKEKVRTTAPPVYTTLKSLES